MQAHLLGKIGRGGGRQDDALGSLLCKGGDRWGGRVVCRCGVVAE